MNNIIELYNEHHLGDNVFMMILFYNIKNYIEENNIIINYYCKEEYHKQLNEFKCSKNINILNLTEKKGLNVWIGNSKLRFHYFSWINNNQLNNAYNKFYVIFFNQLLDMIKIPHKMTYLSYTDNDLLIRYNNFDDKYKNIDILIINSVPMSGQLNYNEEEWNILCEKLNKKYKIITTKKVNNIFCTLDDNLSIKDIAALSTNIKKIIAVNTGVLPGLLNEYTLNNIEYFYFFDNQLNYSYPRFKKINNLEELHFLFEDKQIEHFNNIITNDKILLLLILIFILCLFFL